MMVKIFQNYFITVSIFLMMLILSAGFIMNFSNGFQLFTSLMVILTLVNFTIETWLMKTTLPRRQVRFIQSLVFPISIIIIGGVCFFLLPGLT
ncbi:hypothetical protein CD134_04975 [Staphylococcus lutrae]|uniref:Uncharacterized protein n=1 Tax=Staphylococcus lutrae TaxID=155085 RepID=A0AAC9RRR7_9STAP|nr:hypothetical protein B5P37_03710 [Staphylococcus lutrae]PNZ38207.1 hypothetical protein CD134_04975 [Staphylococcus lutrae]